VDPAPETVADPAPEEPGELELVELFLLLPHEASPLASTATLASTPNLLLITASPLAWFAYRCWMRTDR
jgi:hypothetical protein